MGCGYSWQLHGCHFVSETSIRKYSEHFLTSQPSRAAPEQGYLSVFPLKPPCVRSTSAHSLPALVCFSICFDSFFFFLNCLHISLVSRYPGLEIKTSTYLLLLSGCPAAGAHDTDLAAAALLTSLIIVIMHLKLCALSKLPWAFGFACHEPATSAVCFHLKSCVIILLSYSVLPRGDEVLCSWKEAQHVLLPLHSPSVVSSLSGMWPFACGRSPASKEGQFCGNRGCECRVCQQQVIDGQSPEAEREFAALTQKSSLCFESQWPTVTLLLCMQRTRCNLLRYLSKSHFFCIVTNWS